MFPSGRPASPSGIPKPGEVWLEARILAQLKLSLGDGLRIGAAAFRVTQVLDYRPDQGTGFVNLAPAALINYADIGATRLDSTRQPRDLRGAVRRAAGGRRGFSRLP